MGYLSGYGTLDVLMELGLNKHSQREYRVVNLTTSKSPLYYDLFASSGLHRSRCRSAIRQDSLKHA